MSARLLEFADTEIFQEYRPSAKFCAAINSLSEQPIKILR